MSKPNETLLGLNSILFEQIEKISNEDLKGENLKEELVRNNAVINVAKTIITNASTILKATEFNRQNENYENYDHKLPKMLLSDKNE